jgi:hypothetical protein
MASTRETRKRKAPDALTKYYLDASFSETEMDFSFQQPPTPPSPLNGNKSRGRGRDNGRGRGRGSTRGRGTGNSKETTRPSHNVVVPNTPPIPQSNEGGKDCYIIDLFSFQLFIFFSQGHQEEVVQKDGARESVKKQRALQITLSLPIRPQYHSRMKEVKTVT